MSTVIRTERRRQPKACERCRRLHQRCSGNEPCSTCLASGRTEQCIFRAKPRRDRAPRQEQPQEQQQRSVSLGLPSLLVPEHPMQPSAATSKASDADKSDAVTGGAGGSGAHNDDDMNVPVACLIEHELEALLSRHHIALGSLALKDEQTNSMGAGGDNKAGLDSPSLSQAEQSSMISQFFAAFEANVTPFLSRRHINTQPSSPPERALLFMVLCMSELRRNSFDGVNGAYRSMAPTSGPLRRQHERWDAVWFRNASMLLNDWDGASLAGLRALYLQHIYLSSTTLGAKSRRVVGRMVVMAHELGINTLGGAQRYAPHERASLLYLFTYFADCYLSTLNGPPPLIKRADFDPTVFASRFLFDDAAPSAVMSPAGYLLRDTGDGQIGFDDGGSGSDDLDGDVRPPPTSSSPGAGTQARAEVDSRSLRTLVSLVLRVGELLEQRPRSRDGLAEFVLEEEQRWSQWTTMHLHASTSPPVSEADERVGMSDIVETHYNWCRILIRAPCLKVSGMEMASLCVLLRAATGILSTYQRIFAHGALNLSWPQLRRVTTATHIVLLCAARRELTRAEASSLTTLSLSLLDTLATRWQPAVEARAGIEHVARALGILDDVASDSSAEPLVDDSSVEVTHNDPIPVGSHAAMDSQMLLAAMSHRGGREGNLGDAGPLSEQDAISQLLSFNAGRQPGDYSFLDQPMSELGDFWPAWLG